MISEEEWLAAEERGRKVAETGLYAVAADYNTQTQTISVTLKKGFTVSFPKERSEVMAKASDEDLSDVKIMGAGSYIIFSKLDDGFTVEGMLAGRFGSARWEHEWAETHRQTVAA